MNNIDLTKVSDELFHLLMQLNSKVFNHDKMVKCSPLPPSHVKVIFYLFNNGSSSISDIASMLAISKPNMTPIIDKLIKEDLVYRKEDPNDRRKIRIDLTEKAHNLALEHKKRLKESLLSKISTLSEEDLFKMSDLVSQLTNIIVKLD
ncbi:MarR family winged helix-turn-helix transcriptional regulator [Paraclostridium bifermentans]|uniref:MarR family winged helix-turn-helix transcriptional regulator n=1 Tax=Paraclostridium bifermentans TaxID=1490 RepID=UPI00359C60C8